MYVYACVCVCVCMPCHPLILHLLLLLPVCLHPCNAERVKMKTKARMSPTPFPNDDKRAATEEASNLTKNNSPTIKFPPLPTFLSSLF